MWEARNTTSDFHVYVSIFGDLGGTVLLLYEVVGEVDKFEAHILEAEHQSV